MAILRLTNGGDVAVDLEVEETLAAISIAKGATDFVELPGPEGPIHIRPTSVIAVLETIDPRTSGFRRDASGR